MTLHRRGTSLPYRLRPGVKLGTMLIFGIVVIALRGPWTGAAALVMVSCVIAWARIPPGALWRALRPVVAVIAVLALIQGWQRGWQEAVALVTTTLALVLAATIVTATTPTDAMLDTIAAGLRPARRLGVNPERVALACSLMIGAIEHIASIARQTREAAKARGLERSVRAQLAPLVIRTVGHAQATGEALAARGIGDDDVNATSGTA